MFVSFIEISCLIVVIICFIIVFKGIVISNGFIIIKCIVWVIVDRCYLYCCEFYFFNVIGVV